MLVFFRFNCHTNDLQKPTLIKYLVHRLRNINGVILLDTICFLNHGFNKLFNMKTRYKQLTWVPKAYESASIGSE